MFKVPEWGNDVPKSDVELAKLFAKNNKKKRSQSCTSANKKINGKTDNIHDNGKLKNNTSNIDHVKQKKLLKNHKKLSAVTNNNNNKLESSYSKSELLQNDRSNTNKENVKNKDNNKNKEQNTQVSNKRITIQVSSQTVSNENKKSKKRKHPQNTKRPQVNIIDSKDTQIYDTDEPDKLLVNAKRKKLTDKLKNDDMEDVLFRSRNTADKKIKNKLVTDQSNENSGTDTLQQEKSYNDNEVKVSKEERKILKKKRQLQEVLNKQRSIINTNGNKLRMRMLERLKAAQFRYINEKLYTSTGAEAQELFKLDPTAFQAYHDGYQQQVKKWPINPLDLIVKRIQKMPKDYEIADMGCGRAELARRVAQRVHSFDLVAAPRVRACDMARTPLARGAVHAAVYCLALMGADLARYLLEANRVLKTGGHLLIAEVESRFENVEAFTRDVQRLGFALKKLDNSHKVFLFMEFVKARDAPTKKHKLPVLSLKPCLYKKR